MKKHYPIIIPVFIFIILSLRCIYSPAVYLDAVNPDYLITRMLNPHSLNNNVAWTIPGNLIWGIFPILIQVYHGAIPVYLGLPFYAIFGTDILGIRLTAIMFGVMVLCGLYLCLNKLNIKKYIILLGILSIAVDPSFIFAFRTQFYITLLPITFIFLSMYFLLQSLHKKNTYKYYNLSGLSLGIACYGYFIYFTFIPVIGLFFIYALSHRKYYSQDLMIDRIKSYKCFFSGLGLGMMLYIWGWLSAIQILGFKKFLQWFNANPPLESHISLGARFNNMWHLFTGVIDSSSISNWIFGKNILDFYLYNNLIILSIGVIFSLIYLIICKKNKQQLTHSKNLSLLVCLSLLSAPILLTLIFAKKVSYHHLIIILPIAYSILIATIDQLNFKNKTHNIFISTVLFMNLIAVNLMHDNSFFYYLRTEGGSGNYATVLTDFTNDNLKSNYYIMPDWGISLPYQLITDGYVKVDTELKIDNINKFYLEGKSVNLVLLSTEHNHWVIDIEKALNSKSILKTYVGNGQTINQYTWTKS